MARASSTISKHLKELRERGLVEKNEDGKYTLVNLGDIEVRILNLMTEDEDLSIEELIENMGETREEVEQSLNRLEERLYIHYEKKTTKR